MPTNRRRIRPRRRTDPDTLTASQCGDLATGWPRDIFSRPGFADFEEFKAAFPTETAQDCELNLAGAQVAGTVKVWRITAPSGPTPVPARAGVLVSGPPATIAETTMQQVPRTITLPPASISVYEFEVRQ